MGCLFPGRLSRPPPPAGSHQGFCSDLAGGENSAGFYIHLLLVLGNLIQIRILLACKEPPTYPIHPFFDFSANYDQQSH